ncbi:MAG TPA: PHB depolymerase family esterase [Thermoanaerobaculia bacterium]|nr:PHB depolymerase family esterase [Thermoanaerobaculia bacterium]
MILPARRTRRRSSSLLFVSWLSLAAAAGADGAGRELPGGQLGPRVASPEAPLLATPGSGPGLDASPGLHEVSVQAGGLTRWALYYVPVGYDPAVPSRLVIALHGGGGGMFNMADSRTDLLALADAKTFLVIFPNGQDGVDNRGASGWKAVHCCGEVFLQGQSDVDFVLALVRSFEAGLAVDPRRIHAVGFSNGGMLTHLLAAEASEVFASVAVLSGTIGGSFDLASPVATVVPEAPMPILMIHGIADTNVSYRGGFSSDNAERFDLSFEASMALWVANDGCRQLGTVRSSRGERGAVFRRSHAGCLAGTEVVGISLENVGHTWPDLESAGFDGTTEAVEFFERHPRP